MLYWMSYHIIFWHELFDNINVQIILIISFSIKMSLYALIVTSDLLEDKQKVTVGYFDRRHFVIDFRLF